MSFDGLAACIGARSLALLAALCKKWSSMRLSLTLADVQGTVSLAFYNQGGQ